MPALEDAPLYQAVDGTGVSLLSKVRGTAGRVYGDGAAIGKGGVDRRFFYGVKLVALVSDQGLIHGFISGPANTEERFLLEGLLRWRADPLAEPPTGEALTALLGPSHRHRGQRKGPSGPLGPRYAAGQATEPIVILADDGYAGQAWQTHWHEAFDVRVVTQRHARHQRLGRWLAGKRQVVESAFSRLHDWFALERPRTKSLLGWWVRLSAKVAAHNAWIILNALWDRPLGAKWDLLALP
ncbi:hypothetical protein [Deinococcus multiflagellatus]|uniref:Transposase IS4-like domain-containing protein n=1 Tax=Deinococcus multiflagellatus TaxID=1656887 RepID=A0ABW1ZL04_9DEIO|nr:hypothetical protein [Deinococcus multiflagellatus]MBZ9715722.1 hypothetical protein [Deinococcus multiflagellatus]